MNFTKDSISSVIGIICGLAIVLSPFIIGIVMYKKFNDLKKKNNKDQIGVLYENLDLSRGRSVILVPMMYLIRRILLASIIVFQDNFICQIITMHILGLFKAIIISARPFDDPSQSGFEFFNEFIIMAILLCTMCFTEFVQDPNSQYFMGYVVCVINALHLAFHLVLILQKLQNDLKMRYRRFKFRRNQKIKIAQMAKEKSFNKAEEPVQTKLAPVQEAGSSQEESSSSQISQGADLENQKQSDVNQNNTVVPQTDMTFNEIQQEQIETNVKHSKQKEPVQDILEVTLNELEEIHKKKEQMQQNNSMSKPIVQQMSQLEQEFKSFDKILWNDWKPIADFNTMDQELWNDQKPCTNFNQKDEKIQEQKQQMEQKGTQTVQLTEDIQDEKEFQKYLVMKQKQETQQRLEQIQKKNEVNGFDKYLIDKYMVSSETQKELEYKKRLQIIQDCDIEFEFDSPPVQQQVEQVPQKSKQISLSSQHLTPQQQVWLNRYK